MGRRGADAVPGERSGRPEGVGIIPGHYVFADSSGAMVFPIGQLEEVIEGARAVQAEDAGYREEIRREQLPRKRRSLLGRGP